MAGSQFPNLQTTLKVFGRACQDLGVGTIFFGVCRLPIIISSSEAVTFLLWHQVIDNMTVIILRIS